MNETKNISINVSSINDHPLVIEHDATLTTEHCDKSSTRLILTYLFASSIWLIVGTLIGQMAAIKLVFPDFASESWMSFGRIRPVHTNSVFWGWTSLAMIGLAYYVIPSSSNTKIYSNKIGWISFFLINISVIAGNLMLMWGISNGSQEYREFVWPVMIIFMLGIALTAYNFYQTIAHRNVKEIYISNWFIMAACIWTLTFMIISYLPFYQIGLGETIIQGYYMHMAVGMWFMSFTLGIIYFMLPKLLNRPIYSYSLGILAFWTQLLFYTMIGMHHFIFSPVPWWLQTIAIVFSIGMIIPVSASTANFAFTLKGNKRKIKYSSGLPFILTGVIFYFVASFQGSLSALRFSNLVWHFTDFTIAHSHMTMYGIVTFFLWGSIYGLVPNLTGRQPRTLWVELHFWFALTGLLIYAVALMWGGTERGLIWLNGLPFIQSVSIMIPYWLWRVIGGGLMLTAHFIFAWNLYEMIFKSKRQNP